MIDIWSNSISIVLDIEIDQNDNEKGVKLCRAFKNDSRVRCRLSLVETNHGKGLNHVVMDHVIRWSRGLNHYRDLSVL